jgi:hypothetical protein
MLIALFGIGMMVALYHLNESQNQAASSGIAGAKVNDMECI